MCGAWVFVVIAVICLVAAIVAFVEGYKVDRRRK